MALKGKRVVVTGTFDGMRRSEVESQLTRAGAIVVGEVTKTVDILFVGEDAGGKLARAKALGVKIQKASALRKLVRTAKPVGGHKTGLDAPDPKERAKAAKAVAVGVASGKIRDAEPYLRVIQALLTDRDAKVRRWSTSAVDNLLTSGWVQKKPKHDQALRWMRKMARDPDANVRSEALARFSHGLRCVKAKDIVAGDEELVVMLQEIDEIDGEIASDTFARLVPRGQARLQKARRARK
jgi:hypothetical protein